MHQTMQSLFNSDVSGRSEWQMYICVGTPHSDYALRHESVDPRISIHPLPQTEWDAMAGETIHTRFTRNYLRCLSFCGPAGILVLEDDVLVRSDWVRCLEMARNEISSDHIDNHVLALYYPSQARLLPRGVTYSAYKAMSFFGTQAMYYSPEVVTKIIDFVEPRIHTLPGDLLLRRWFLENKILYATAIPLAQHVGFTSTGLGFMHQAVGFDAPWPRPQTPHVRV